jgi:transcriptional regulator with PAS, ATPase and Fis domain
MPSTNRETRYQKWNLSSVVSSTERARCELTKEMKCSNTGFSDFLERKKRYGFQFSKSLIRRHQPKSEFPDQQASEFQALDDDIMSNLKKIEEKVRLQTIESGKLTNVFTKFEEMHKQFEKAKTKEGINRSTVERLKQMKKLANKADLSVKSYKENSPKDWKFLMFKTKCQKKLYKEFEQIDGTLDILARSIEAYGIELEEEMSSVVGLEEDIHELVSQLITDSEHFSFVSIVGMMGIGKTTLAKKIYEHSDIVEHFPCRAWVSVPQAADCDALSIDVAKQVGAHGSQEELNGREYRMNKVCILRLYVVCNSFL